MCIIIYMFSCVSTDVFLVVRFTGGVILIFWQQLLIVCPLVFFAGLVDSIAGGGGIISLPAYHAAGVLPHMALATNKFASFCGTSVSTARFIKSGKIKFKAALASVPAALFGSFLGTKLALVASETVLRYFLIVFLPIAAVFILRSKNFKEEGFPVPLPDSKMLLLSGLAGLIIGAYDGFFGPGTGTFLIVIFNTVIGFDILTASGNAKAINWSSNCASLVTFLLAGQVVFSLAIPAAICGICGNYIGSGLALKKGMRVVKPILIVVLILLLIKIGLDALEQFHIFALI